MISISEAWTLSKPFPKEKSSSQRQKRQQIATRTMAIFNIPAVVAAAAATTAFDLVLENPQLESAYPVAQ